MAIIPEDLHRFASIRTIDFTTFGRKSGKPRRIEIWWFHVNGRFIITGTPGQRDWLANVKANPSVVVHVGGHDIETTASVIEDRQRRLEVFSQPETRWYSSQAQLDRLINEAPMIEIDLWPPASTGEENQPPSPPSGRWERRGFRLSSRLRRGWFLRPTKEGGGRRERSPRAG